MAWRALVLAGVPDDAILPAIEQVLILRAPNDAEVFATLAMVTLDLAARTATVRLAGHPPPLLLTSGSVAWRCRPNSWSHARECSKHAQSTGE